jgi:hypothetical protein
MRAYGTLYSVPYARTENVYSGTYTGTRHVILAKHRLWLPDDGFRWTETCWNSFYNSNCFNKLTINIICVHWLDNKEFDIINARCNYEDYLYSR